jgi:hypothetical protein
MKDHKGKWSAKDFSGWTQVKGVATAAAKDTAYIRNAIIPRPTVTQYVTGYGSDPAARRRAGMTSGLMGMSRLTG